MSNGSYAHVGCATVILGGFGLTLFGVALDELSGSRLAPAGGYPLGAVAAWGFLAFLWAVNIRANGRRAWVARQPYPHLAEKGQARRLLEGGDRQLGAGALDARGGLRRRIPAGPTGRHADAGHVAGLRHPAAVPFGRAGGGGALVERVGVLVDAQELASLSAYRHTQAAPASRGFFMADAALE